MFKGGEHLERAHKVNAVVLDKTGTITKGEPAVTDVIGVGGYSEDQVLQLAAVAERGSEHPSARRLSPSRGQGLAQSEPENFAAIPGQGISATVDGHSVYLGNRRLMEEQGISTEELDEKVQRLESEGKTAMLLAVDGQLAGIVAVADTVKPTSRQAIEVLKSMGVDVYMLTGDNRRTAQAIAAQVGLDPQHVLAEVLPEEKAREVEKLQQRGLTVGMVGDGINDAPALATADVGFAIGTGTDVAIESGDVTLMQGDLQGIPAAIQLSRSTMRNIKQNLFWALVYNSLGIPVAAFGFLSPILAGAAMAFSSVSVVSNALRLRRWRYRQQG